MNNMIFGILIMIICIIIFFFSWYFYKKNFYKTAVLLLVLGGFFLRVFTASDLYLHKWDERYHALVAKNMTSQPFKPMLYKNPILEYDYKNWSGNHVWVHKQPLPLWTIAASMSIFGFNEFALRFPSILLTCLGIILMFSVARFLLNKKKGYVAAFFFSINGLIIELSAGRVATDHIDIFYLFFILLSVFFCIQFIRYNKIYYNILCGFCIGAAILCKWLPALITLPIWLVLVYDSKKYNYKQIVFHFSILILMSVFVFLPWQIYIFEVFPKEAQWEASFNIKHFFEVLDGRTGPFYYFFEQIRINYGELIYLPLIWFSWLTFKNSINKKHLALLIWIFIPLIFFSIAKTKMQAYILFISPALFMITADFFIAICTFKIKNNLKWILNVILILLIALPIRYSIERIKPFEQRIRSPKWVSDLKILNQENLKNGILFNYNNPIEAMFYTDLSVYSHIPNPQKINELLLSDYLIIINDNGQIPKDIKSINGIIFKQLLEEK